MKKLYLVFAFIASFFACQTATANSFYAKSSIAVAEESTGLGTVYFIGSNNEDVTEKVESGSSQTNSAYASFRVKITPAEGYQFDHFTEDNGKAFTYEDPITGIVVEASGTAEEPTLYSFKAHFVPVGEGGGENPGDGGEEESSEYQFTRTVSSFVKWSTLLLPVDCTLPDAVVAYKVTGIKDGALIKTALTGGIVPANTPVLLENTGMLDATLTATFDKALLDGSEKVEGLLHGVLGETVAEVPENAYAIAMNSTMSFGFVQNARLEEALQCYLLAEGENLPTELGMQSTEGEGGTTDPEPQPTGIEVEFSESGYLATYFEKAVKIPAGVTAYTAVGVDGVLVSMVPQRNKISANTGVLLKAEAGKYSFEDYTGFDMGTYSCLKPVAKDGIIPASDTENNRYVLQTLDGKYVFQKVEEDITATQNTAYLEIGIAPDTTVFNVYYLESYDIPTTIAALNAMKSDKAQIYDLNGRRLQKMQKGINIVNGVRVLVK